MSSVLDRVEQTKWVIVLRELMDEYPDLLYLGDNGQGLYMHRQKLICVLEMSHPDINFNTFERALRDAGLYVAQTTHDPTVPKIWRAHDKKTTKEQGVVEMNKNKDIWRHETLLTDDNWPVEGRPLDFWVGSGPLETFVTLSGFAAALNVQATNPAFADNLIHSPPKSWRTSSVVDRRVQKIIRRNDMKAIMDQVMDGKHDADTRVRGMLAQIDSLKRASSPSAPAPAPAPKDTQEKESVARVQVRPLPVSDSNRPATLRDLARSQHVIISAVKDMFKEEVRLALRVEIERGPEMDNIRAAVAEKYAREIQEQSKESVKRLREEELERQAPVIREEVKEELRKRYRQELESVVRDATTRELAAKQLQEQRVVPARPTGLSTDEIRAMLQRFQAN